MSLQHYSQEWLALQSQHDKFECYSLIIKLVAIGLSAFILVNDNISLAIIALAPVLWLQDAIWKTYQARTEAHLLVLEKVLAGEIVDDDSAPFQFNQSFQNNRPGLIGLTKEYLAQASRPTVAFPHVVLTALLVFA